MSTGFGITKYLHQDRTVRIKKGNNKHMIYGNELNNRGNKQCKMGFLKTHKTNSKTQKQNHNLRGRDQHSILVLKMGLDFLI